MHFQRAFCRRQTPADLPLDLGGVLFRLLLAPVGDLPAWAFRHEAAQEQDEAAQCRADAEAKPPAEIDPTKRPDNSSSDPAAPNGAPAQ